MILTINTTKGIEPNETIVEMTVVLVPNSTFAENRANKIEAKVNVGIIVCSTITCDVTALI